MISALELEKSLFQIEIEISAFKKNRDISI